MAPLVREPRQVLYAMTAVLGTTPVLPFQDMSGGMIFLRPNSNVTGIAFYAADANSPDITGFVPVYDQTKTLVAYSGLAPSTTGLAIPIPDACFGAGALKLVGAFSSGTSEFVPIALKG